MFKAAKIVLFMVFAVLLSMVQAETDYIGYIQSYVPNSSLASAIISEIQFRTSFRGEYREHRSDVSNLVESILSTVTNTSGDSEDESVTTISASTAITLTKTGITNGAGAVEQGKGMFAVMAAFVASLIFFYAF